MFQSTPGFKAGRYPVQDASITNTIGFNPLPALRPGDTLTGGYVVSVKSGFNPLPALRPGDTYAHTWLATANPVSIHSRL